MEILDGGRAWPPGSASAQQISESKIFVAWREGLRKYGSCHTIAV